MAYPHPEFSIILPSLAQTEYLELFLRYLQQNRQHDLEVLVHVYPRGDLPVLKGYEFPVNISADDIPGMGHACNMALKRARGEWLLFFADDLVPLEGWDNFEGRLRPDRVLCWDLLEPSPGSYSPPCEAGTHPRDFRYEIALQEAKRRTRPAAEPGKFFGHFIFHRSLLASEIRWPETPYYATADIDLPYQIYSAHPQVTFGRLGLCIYHFARASIVHHPELQRPGDEVQQQFVDRFGITTGEAYDRINSRSSLWTA